MPFLDAMHKLIVSRAGRALDPAEAKKVAEKLVSLTMAAPHLVSSTGYAKILRVSINYFSKAEADLKRLITVGELVGYDMSEEKLLDSVASMKATWSTFLRL